MFWLFGIGCGLLFILTFTLLAAVGSFVCGDDGGLTALLLLPLVAVLALLCAPNWVELIYANHDFSEQGWKTHWVDPFNDQVDVKLGDKLLKCSYEKLVDGYAITDRKTCHPVGEYRKHNPTVLHPADLEAG